MNLLEISFPERRFSVWSYTTSHSELLFRSPKWRDGRATQIDVLFKGVTSAELRFADLRDLSVRAVDTADQRSTLTQRAYLENYLDIEPAPTLYEVRSGKWCGYVVAIACHWIENDREPNDPTAFEATE